MSTERELLQQAHEICLLVGSLDLAREIKAALARPAQIGSRTGSDYQQGFEDGMAEARLASELSHPEQEPTLSPRPYNELPNHPMFDAFIRAFWRRINAYKNGFDKELPEEMPVQLRASMETALLVFDKDESSKGRPMQRLTDEENEHFQKPIGELEISLSGFSFHPEDKSFLLTNMPIGEYPLYTDPQPLKRLADTESLEISKQFGGMSTREWGIVAAFEKAYGIKEKL
jgi:hypothetical protein